MISVEKFSDGGYMKPVLFVSTPMLVVAVMLLFFWSESSVTAKDDLEIGHCQLYDRYTAVSQFTEYYETIGGGTRFLLLLNDEKQIAYHEAKQSLYNILKLEKSLDCSERSSGTDSAIVETMFVSQSQNLFDPIVRKGYLTASKFEIGQVLRAMEEYPEDMELRYSAMLMIQHAENVWKFTPQELGVPLDIQNEIFPVF